MMVDDILTDRSRWKPGEIAVIRGVLKAKLWWACPTYVVRDSPGLVALFWRVGTPTRSPVKRPTVEDEINNRIQLHDRNWIEHDVLALVSPGSAHMVQVMWHAGTRNTHYWYVHLQEPLRRTAVGFDTMDQMLDIVISPDRSSWLWKDEDEFLQAEQMGLYSHEKVNAIHAEGDRVIRLLETNSPPFCDGWENWVPPADWGIPTFPAGWEKVALS